MLNLEFIRQNADEIKDLLKTRQKDAPIDKLLSLDTKYRNVLGKVEELSHLRNKANHEVVQLKKSKGNADAKIAEMKKVSDDISALKAETDQLSKEIKTILMTIPNTPAEGVPLGDPTKNKVLREEGDKPTYDFKPKSHMELGEKLGILNFAQSAKISGAAFTLFKGDGAKLERALIQFMLDLQTNKHGYTEIAPPFLVKRRAMEGTGQLPKFEEDMYRIFRGSKDDENGEPHDEDLFLIPTAEVPVTNMHREEVIKDALPITYAAYTPCFRLEAGSYGKDTKGMTRVHQFDKVELVRFVKPENSEKEHDLLLSHAEKVFQELGIHYRVVLLSSGDMGFSAKKCYDIEIWSPGLGQWLEASSVSNFGDFQARRMSIKFKDKIDKKAQYVHTLNGSGVALARTFIAVLENFQQKDGSIAIPKVLQSYMGGQKVIK